MKPTIQSSKIEICNVKSNSLTIKWKKGDGDGRIVVVTPEIEKEKDLMEEEIDSIVGSNNLSSSTYLNPDPFLVRQYFPGYPSYAYYQHIMKDSNNKNYCRKEKYYIPPFESLPIDGNDYSHSIIYGEGSELNVTERANVSYNTGICSPNQPITQSPISYELIEDVGFSNEAYIVYKGNGSETSIINLKPSMGYYISIYEYNIESNNCYNYLVEENSEYIVTSSQKEYSNFTFDVKDCRTERPLISHIEILDSFGNIVDMGKTDGCGYYKSRDLEVKNSYKVIITAPKKNDYILNKVYLRGKPDTRQSDLYPNWTQGTRRVTRFSVSEEDKRINSYDILF